MIIWTEKSFLLHETACKAGNIMGRYVWKLEYYNQKHWLGFGFGRNYQYYSTNSNKWIETYIGEFMLFINLKLWKLGSEHIWYDGPHCFYSFGPFHLNTSKNNCKKCNG